ncbi:MAG: hypothetical protein EAY65_02515 [Alphaproteobacteria bacterium]|nr:MAG: hypothetical protein EAY65_02515 [Alphaproteobacteria bacterium]
MNPSHFSHRHINFAQLLLTRFCHDITGPVGAIHNGVEFLHDSGSMQHQAIELIEQSAHHALVRIQLFRYLYGILKEQGDADIVEHYKLLQNYFEGSKTTLGFEIGSLRLSHEACRLLLNLVIIMGACLIRGGSCAIEQHQNPPSILIVVHGSNVRMEDKVQQALVHPDIHIPDTQTIHVYYAALLAQHLGATLTLDVQETFAHLRLIWSDKP